MKLPKISVVVPTFNSEKTVKKCIGSILNSKPFDLELIIVDDYSTDNTKNILKSYLKNKNVRLVFHKQNKGTATTCNDGARIARGKYIVILGSDVIVRRDCIAKLVEPLEKNDSIGMTQGSLINVFSNQIETVGHFLTIFGFPYELDGKYYEDYVRPLRILGSRAVTSCRAELYKTIGGYDEDYIFHGDDTDFAWRVSLAGYKSYYIPQAKAYHHHIKSEKTGIVHYLFYEGPKNQISNILKNAPIEYLWLMLPLNILVWILLSLKLLLQLRFAFAFLIYKGLLWNILNFNRTMKKRRKIHIYAAGVTLSKKIMFGPLSFINFFQKGLSWFSRV